MNILSRRVAKLEEASGLNSPKPYQRIICNIVETPANALKRLGIDSDDGVNRIFRVLIKA